MDNKSDFTVHFPIELVEEWVKQNGVDDGQMLEYQDLLINEIKLDVDTGYITIGGSLETKLDG